MPKPSIYTRKYSVGQFVDIIVDSSVHKGMPYSFYHGRTGRILNINRRSVDVVIKKVVGPKEVNKVIRVRVEHVRPSRCAESYAARREEWAKERDLARKNGKSVRIQKRIPEGPRKAMRIPRPADMIELKAQWKEG